MHKKDASVGDQDKDRQDSSSEVIKEEEVVADSAQNDKGEEIEEGSDSKIGA